MKPVMPPRPKVNTDRPWARKAPICSSQAEKARAGWPLAVVSSSRHRRPGWSGVSARKAATAALPRYHSAYGGMDSSTSSASSATTASTSFRSQAAMNAATVARTWRSPTSRSTSCWLRSGSAVRIVPLARASALVTDGTVVPRISAVSTAENASTSRSTSTARCSAGRCWSAAMNPSSTASRCS